jgi:hypothetical protein
LEVPLVYEDASQFDKTVIPGEPNDVGRDPESKKITRNQIILNPPPLSARMTNCDPASTDEVSTAH